MRTLVESLKRLYAQGKVTEQKLQSMMDAGTITADEFAYITGDGK